MDPVTIQAQKMFYVPWIFKKDLTSGLVLTLLYAHPKYDKTDSFYASRVMPGQSLIGAITDDLAKDFKYTGSFHVLRSLKLDKIPDKNQIKTDRYAVSIVLFDDFDIDKAHPLGCKLSWGSPAELEANGFAIFRQRIREPKKLDDNDLLELENMLNVKIDRMKIAEEERYFHYLEFIPDIRVSDDWKWDDEWVMKQVSSVAPELNLEYDHDSGYWAENRRDEGYSDVDEYLEHFDKEIWRMKFKMLGEVHEVRLKRLEINVLMDEINTVLSEKFKKQFIDVDTFSDALLFVLAPVDLSRQRFESIIYNERVEKYRY